MPKLLMLAECYPPINLSGSARPFFFSKYLPQFGFDVEVIARSVMQGDPLDYQLLEGLTAGTKVRYFPLCASPVRDFLMDKVGVPAGFMTARDRARRKSKGLPIIEADQHLGVASAKQVAAKGWAKMYRLAHPLLWKAYWHGDWGLSACIGALLARSSGKFDAVWATGPQSRNVMAGYYVSQLLGIPLIVDLRDPWTYGSIWTHRSDYTAAHELSQASKVLAHATKIIFTSPLTAEEMGRRFPDETAGKLCTVTNGYEADEVKAERELGPDVCLFQYTGVLNERRRPDVLIQAFESASKRDKDFARSARLQFVGGLGGNEAALEKSAIAASIRVIPHVPRARSVELIRGADVNILLQTIDVGQDVIASKMFEYLAAKKSILVIAAADSGDAWFAKENDCAAFADFRESEQIVEQLLALFKKWRLNQGSQDSNFEEYSWPERTRALAKILSETLNPS